MSGTKNYTIAIEKGYIKGNTKGENVTGTTLDAYPKRGEQGGIWYVYKGVT